MKDVKDRLAKEFRDLEDEKYEDVIEAIIDHVDTVIKKFLEEIETEEEIEAEEEIKGLCAYVNTESDSESSFSTIRSLTDTSFEFSECAA